jgi:hypothetical protein
MQLNDEELRVLNNLSYDTWTPRFFWGGKGKDKGPIPDIRTVRNLIKKECVLGAKLEYPETMTDEAIYDGFIMTAKVYDPAKLRNNARPDLLKRLRPKLSPEEELVETKTRLAKAEAALAKKEVALAEAEAALAKVKAKQKPLL